MELAAELQQNNFALDLEWVPRDQNTEADELSNFQPHRFSPEQEIKVKVEDLDFIILNDMLAEGEKLYQKLEEAKQSRPAPTGVPAERKKRKPEARLRVTHPW